MIITKEGFWKLEKDEFEITTKAIMSSLVAHWLIAKRYRKDDLLKKGLNWNPRIEQNKGPITPREFFNYVYINEVVRDGHYSPPSLFWIRSAEGRLEDWERSGRKKEWKFFQMHKVLEKHGWSLDPEKSKRGSIKGATHELELSRTTLYNRIRICPRAPELPWEQQFARMILEHYYEMLDRIGNFWFWRAGHLLPPEYGGQNYVPRVSVNDFMKHNRGRKELDFSVLNKMYEEFSKLKLVRYGSWKRMVLTKGEVKVTDLREGVWKGTTGIDWMRYELTGVMPNKGKSKDV